MTGWDITGDDLQLWAGRVEAFHQLPELLRRLLMATAPLSSIEMPADGGTRRPGWDGVVASNAPHLFCPEGLSRWELSVQGDAAKLNRDYAKRTKSPGKIDLRATTYVAVSARRVADKQNWEDRKRRDGRWNDVRVLDADDLATWLARAPAVTRWLGHLLGKPSFQTITLEELLESWCSRTRPPFSRSLLVAGRLRTRDAARVIEWAQSDEPRLTIRGDTAEDALMFAAAAFATDQRATAWYARVAVVESREALRWISRLDSSEPLIVLPAYQDFDVKHADGKARIIVAAPRVAASKTGITLEDPPIEAIAKVLTASGFKNTDAERLATQSGGKLRVLQRLCDFDTTARWHQAHDRNDLAVALLIGGWAPAVQADGDVVRALGSERARLEVLFEALSTGEHPTTVKDHDRWARPSWHWVAPVEAWTDLGSEIPSAALGAFADVAISVLSERDPKFDLPIEQRFAAGFHGKVIRHSTALRRGLAESVARLAYNDAALERLHGVQIGSRLADRIVRAVLVADWIAWASLDDLLPVLAEAAPSAFLDRLASSLESGANGVRQLLEQESTFGYPHVPLIGALETLGSHPLFMPRVAMLLARLASADVHADKPGRVVNRPARSLAALVHPLVAATAAPAADRLVAVRSVLQELPEIGFTLTLRSLDTERFGIAFAGRPAEFAPWARLSFDELQERAGREASQNLRDLALVAIQAAGTDADRWARLLAVAYRVNDELEVQILEALESIAPTLSDPAALVWAALRETLHRDTWFEKSPPASRALRKNHYARLTPHDAVVRASWLFDGPVTLPDGKSADWERTAARVAEARNDALEAVWNAPGRAETLLRLAMRVKDPSTLGHALARSSFADAIRPDVLDDAGGRYPSLVRAGYVAMRVATSTEHGWVGDVLERLVREARVDEAFDIAARLPTTMAFWRMFDSVSAAFAEVYWSRLESFFTEGADPLAVDYAVRRLLAAGNVCAAAEISFRGKDQLRPEVIFGALERLNGGELGRFLGRPIARYMIQELLVHLDAAGFEPSLLAVLEMRFLPLFHEGRYRPKHFSAAMAEDASFFVTLVSSLYQRDDHSDDNAPDDESELRANAAGQILDAWRGYPGDAEPPEQADERLFAWADAALAGLADAGCARTGTREVARVLARASSKDGHWPCIAARRLLQKNAGVDLAGRLRTEKRNLRGMTSRAVGEGGRQERRMAGTYRASSQALRATWPAAAGLLDDLAADYLAEAAEQDAGAKATRRREGLDIPTTSDELPPSQRANEDPTEH